MNIIKVRLNNNFHECPFCDIDYEKNVVIKDGKHCFVTLSNPRLMKGHLLVIPKRHVEKLSELNEAQRQELLAVVIEFQEKILQKIASGCDICQNHRPFQKQDGLKVNHLHIHLLPREFKDELYEKCQIHETSIFRKLEDGEKAQVVELLGM